MTSSGFIKELSSLIEQEEQKVSDSKKIPDSKIIELACRFSNSSEIKYGQNILYAMNALEEAGYISGKYGKQHVKRKS